ncbi:MAG: TolC family protein [Planctomycetia bacterium]|nr:TolC family protein [Planctomycetia bacterium]
MIPVGLSGVVFLLGYAAASTVFAENIDQAWEIALRESRKLQAEASMTAAAVSTTSAAQAARLPKVTNATAYTALSDRPDFKATTPDMNLSVFGTQVTIPSMTFATPLMEKDFLVSTTQASVPLYTGGKISSLVEQADAAARAASAGQITGVQDLKIGVAENYLLVLRIQGLVEVLLDTQKAIEAHEKMAQDMFKQGLVTKNVLLSAQVAKSDIDQKVIQAKNTLQVAESAYNRFLWRPLTTPVQLELVQIPSTSGDLGLLTEAALANRSELRQLAAQSQAVWAKSREHRSERLPMVGLTGGYTYVQNEYITENDYWSATVGMVWSPIDGGVSRSKQRAAEHKATAITKMLDEARSGVELQVRKCWLEEQDSRERVAVAKKAIERSEENLRMVNHQFQSGLVTHTEVLDAVALYTQARMNYCNAAYDAILATYRLRRATGSL